MSYDREREEFDENYSHHQQVLEKRIAKFTKSKESADSPFNNPPNYGNKSMSRYQLTERVAKGEHLGTIQDQSKQQSHEKDTYTNRYQNNGDTRRTIENNYGNGTSQRSNYKHEQVQTSPKNGSQYQGNLSSGQDIHQNAKHETSSYNPYSDSQAYPNTERGYQAKQDNNRSEFPDY